VPFAIFIDQPNRCASDSCSAGEITFACPLIEFVEDHDCYLIVFVRLRARRMWLLLRGPRACRGRLVGIKVDSHIEDGEHDLVLVNDSLDGRGEIPDRSRET